MDHRKRKNNSKQYALFFLLGVVFGGYLSSRYIQRFIQDCIDLSAGIQTTGETGARKFIFIGVVRSTTDPNETGVIRRMIISRRVHAKVFCTKRQENDTLYIRSEFLDKFYYQRYSYNWFVQTADVLVDTNILIKLLSYLSTRIPIALVHPDCSSISVLVVNQAGLLLLLGHQMSGPSICDDLQGINVMSLEKVWRRYERRFLSGQQDINYNISLTFPLRNDNLHNILILHQQQRINLLRERLTFLRSQINFITTETSLARIQSWNQVQRKFAPYRKANPKEWSFINNSFIHSLDNTNKQPMENVHNRGRQFMFHLTRSAIQTTCLCEPTFAYQRVDITAGVMHVIVHNCCRRDYKTIQPFEGYKFLEVTKPKDTTIIIVLPLFKRSSIFSRFFKRLRSIALDYKGTLVLQVVLFKDKSGNYKKTLTSIKQTSRNVIVNVVMAKGRFSRAKAIVQGLENFDESALVLIMDVDMMFTLDFLQRVVSTTIQGKQAFFPIPFSRYDPGKIPNINTTGHIKKRTPFSGDFGRWRYFSYGIASIYKSDVVKVGHFDTAVKGWGKEDVFFFEKCVSSGLAVFRSVDPGLWHMYHIRHCDRSLNHDQLRMCQQSKIELESSQQSLADYVLRLLNYVHFT